MKTKLLLLVVSLSLGMVACSDAGEERTEEEQTTTMQEDMKVVQPAVDSAYNAAAEGDSSLLKDDRPQE